MYVPDIKKQATDDELELNKKEDKIEIVKFNLNGITYGFDKKSLIVYDYDAIKQGNFIPIGKQIINKDGEKEIKFNFLNF